MLDHPGPHPHRPLPEHLGQCEREAPANAHPHAGLGRHVGGRVHATLAGGVLGLSGGEGDGGEVVLGLGGALWKGGEGGVRRRVVEGGGGG